jgi:hypothetical protein
VPYPTGSDLFTFLRASGLITADQQELKALLDLDSVMLGAVQEFERLTRRTPFLNSALTVTTKSFRVESTIVNFTNTPGLVSMDSGADAISSQSVNYTVGQNVQLLPLDNPAQGRPYTYLKFGGVNSGPPEEWNGFLGGSPSFLVAGGSGWMINVRGVWGYCTVLPADVKSALCARCCVKLAPRLALIISGGLYSERRLNSETRYGGGGVSPFSIERKMWQEEWDAAVVGYRARY